jgi:hypothetical protein
MNFIQWHLWWSLIWMLSLSWIFRRLPLSPTSDDNAMSDAAVHCINTEGMFSELSVLFPEWITSVTARRSSSHSSCPPWVIETDNLCMQQTWTLHSQTQHPRCHCIQFQWQLPRTEDQSCDLAMLKIDKDACHSVTTLEAKTAKKKKFHSYFN